MAILAIMAIMAMMAISAIIFKNVGANKLLKGTQSIPRPLHLEGMMKEKNPELVMNSQKMLDSILDLHLHIFKVSQLIARIAFLILIERKASGWPRRRDLAHPFFPPASAIFTPENISKYLDL